MASRPLSSFLSRAEALGRFAENAALSMLLIGLVLLSSYQILLRNVFSTGLPWADEVIRIAVLWLAAVGALAASRDRSHIAINLVVRALPARFARLVGACVNGFSALIAGILAWQSWRFLLDSRTFEETVLGGLPAWPFQLVLPVCFALIAYRYAVSIAAALEREST